MKYKKERKKLIQFCKRLYNKNLTTSLGGNLSIRLKNKIILITPSAVDKKNIKKKEIVILDANGKNYTPDIVPSIEKNLHLNIYKIRNDVQAIIHAHPSISSAFTTMKKNINTNLLAESRIFLGIPSKIPYLRQGSEALATKVSEAFKLNNVVIMQNHGVITVGKTMIEAFERIEVLESAAKITLITELLNDKIEIAEKELKFLDSIL